MSELKICRICLRTEAKVYNYEQFQLKSFYEEVLALKVSETDELPHYFCFECATLLHKFHKFKEKCYVGQKVLKDMLSKGQISYEAIYKLDFTNLSSLSNLALKYNVVKIFSTEDDLAIKEETIQHDQRFTKIENVEIACFDDPDVDRNDDVYPSFDDDTDSDTKSTIVQEKTVEDIEAVKIEIEDAEDNCNEKNKGEYTLKRSRLLNSKHWSKKRLSEEEAIKEFRQRAESEKYMIAAFKCTDCFKGFSKEEMLKRHRKLTHNQSGSVECRFCRMRFKWNCHLKKHIRQHYIRNTALLHDIYHSGITKKCVHCNEEFRHFSTYYTHLRTHRSEHLCTLCGSSFVSEMGLHMHKRVKHCFNVVNDEAENDIESPGDDEEVDTFCERCDIRFETRKAYDEHLFHSAMHSEGYDDERNHEDAQPRKILGKVLKAKITSRLRDKKRSNEDIFKPQKKKFRRIRRARTKPTTCHQCGKHFETQAACMKHHLSEHPRTSFFAPNERHICEICGASLAPGSVTAHQNMHTRERLHPCETCGKQFHSSVGLKRHAVTHTGEKPYGCTLCDKRFTQNNSMKLHYRTFHLMQPYPKRNRRYKKEEVNASIAAEEVETEDNTTLSKSKSMVTVIESSTVAVDTAAVTVSQDGDNNLGYLTIGYQKYP
ncbi:zinc finger protein 431 isoform X2 [Bicyclus anynana]|uniref:Zinc finger protein 431 isoform X2 n=1 Tax=Bicyclus anynana TaxID=110368 RepID=A0ABM3LRI0_BICAN|nr:zinc finger protein 431 isoform X2 [Bicyclus anynana]